MVTGIDNLISELDNLMAERRRITQAILSLTDRIHGLNHTGQEPISRPPDQPTTPEVEAIPPSNPAPSPVPAAVVGAVAAPDPRAGSVRSQAIRIIGDAGQISIGDLGLALYGIANRVTYRRAASLLTYLQTAGYARRAGRGLWVLKEGAPTGPEVETADDRVANHEAPPASARAIRPSTPRSAVDERILLELRGASPQTDRDLALAVAGDVTPAKRQDVARRLQLLERAGLASQTPDGRWALSVREEDDASATSGEVGKAA